MNTNIKKKGKSAIAIILSLALVLTTATFPVSVAKADTPTVPITMSLSMPGGPEGTIVNYPLTAGTNFVFIKQGNSENVLWSPLPLSPDQLAAIKSQLTGKAESLDGYWTYIVGYKSHTIDPAHGADYIYTFALNPDGTATFTYMGGKVSHFFYGHVAEYAIEVTKAITLNGEDINPLEDTSFFVALFDAAGVEGTMIGEKKEIVVEDNVVLNTAKFIVTDPEASYYVFEVDAAGNKISTGIEIEGFTLASITNQGVEVTDISLTTASQVTITNNLTGLGQISVTKNVEVTDDSGLLVDQTFYAGLFTKDGDEYELVKFGEGEEAVNAIAILDIDEEAFTDEDSATVTDAETFINLDLYQTYYVFETDVNGVIIETDGIDNGSGNILPLRTEGWYALAYDKNEIELTPTNRTGSVTITNYFDPGDDLPLAPTITVIKSVTENGDAKESTLTFYVGLFADPELKTLIAVKPLVMNGKTSSDPVSFAYSNEALKLPLELTTYYIAETDKDGKPLVGTAKEIGFEISIDKVATNNAAVKLVQEETTVNIVNNFKKTEEFPLTGDNSNMNLWLFLAMLGVAGAIAPFAFRKKEVAND
jgi:hypothetical protein